MLKTHQMVGIFVTYKVEKCRYILTLTSNTFLALPHFNTSITRAAPLPLFTISLHPGEGCQWLFQSQNPHKAARPDSVSPSTLKHCADQLSPVFTDIFNTSLETCHVPACFQVSTINTIPPKPRPTGLNDYRPVALTSVVMKCF